MNITIENVALNQIRAYAKNAKNHPESQIQQIAASIHQFGFNNPILVDENLEIIAGHGRMAAAQPGDKSVQQPSNQESGKLRSLFNKIAGLIKD